MHDPTNPNGHYSSAREAQRSNTRRPRNTYRIYYSLTLSSIRLNPVGRQVLSWRLGPQHAGTGERGNCRFKKLLRDATVFYSCLQIYPEPSCSGKTLSPCEVVVSSRRANAIPQTLTARGPHARELPLLKEHRKRRNHDKRWCICVYLSRRKSVLYISAATS
jgi:hypothetical protein